MADEPIRYHTRLQTARGRLAAFVADVEPRFRPLVLGLELTGWDRIYYDELSDEDRARCDAPTSPRGYSEPLGSLTKASATFRDRGPHVRRASANASKRMRCRLNDQPSWREAARVRRS